MARIAHSRLPPLGLGLASVALGAIGLMLFVLPILAIPISTCGLVLGLIGLVRILVWQAVGQVYGEHYLLVALTVAGSLVGVVMFGTLAGSLLPFVMRRLGFDPATSSAPFVATLVDVTGLCIYFTVALMILKGTLL